MGTKKRIAIILVAVAMIAVLGVCLVACNSGDYATRLSKKGYKVSVVKDEEADELTSVMGVETTLEYGDVVWMVSGTRVLEGRRDVETDSVYICKFRNKDIAKEVYEDIQDYIDEMKYGMSSYLDFDYEVKQEGTIVFYGTSNAIKDAK